VARVGENWQTPSNSGMNRVFHTGQGVSDWLRKFWPIRDNSSPWNWLFVLLFGFFVSYLPNNTNRNFIDCRQLIRFEK
jgi:hypothetical protein